MAHDQIKAQMSLEMLAYISIAGISMIYSARAISTFYSGFNQSIIGYEYATFSDQVNTAILNNYSSLRAYVPYGFCPSGINGTEFDTKYGKVYFAEYVMESGNVICGPGAERINLSYYYGYVRMW